MQMLFASKKTMGPLVQVVLLGSMALGLLAAALPAQAETQTAADTPFNQRYEPESIQSVETADIALNAAADDRRILADRYVDDQRECYHKFFVSSCLEDAKERNRVSIKAVKEVEAAANSYKRQAKADDRDKSLADQRIKDEQDAKRRAADQKSRIATSVRKTKDGAAKQRSVSAREAKAEGHADDRVKAHDAKLRSDRAAEAAKAPQRAANTQAYQDKQKAAAAHRQDVAAKKAAKQRELAAKQQQTPATDSTPAK